MSKQLRFTYQDKEYCLEYTRKSVEQMEKRGFVASDITTKPMSTLPALFAGAFLANHRFVDGKVIDDIFKQMKNKDDLIARLAEMYNEPILALVDEPEEAEGNVDWTPSW
jgi:hypothetical protein